MGCDIHCYIEYRKPDEREPDRWRDFGGRINPGRNYAVFGFLAGVRREGPAVVAPRGMPADAAYESKDDNDLWVARGSSKYIKDKDGKNAWVSHPGWHTHSWMTTNEFEKAVSLAIAEHPQYPEPEYTAIIAAMRSFEKQGFEARVVFWFDN